MRTILAAAAMMMAAGCSGTAPFPPEPFASTTSVDAGVVQCMAQEGVAEDPNAVAYELDGAVRDLYTADECQLYFNVREAGAYTGP